MFHIYSKEYIANTNQIFELHSQNRQCLGCDRFSFHDFQAQIHQKDTSISHNKYPKLIDFSNHVRICL